jgi:hypothetical protein
MVANNILVTNASPGDKESDKDVPIKEVMSLSLISTNKRGHYNEFIQIDQ